MAATRSEFIYEEYKFGPINIDMQVNITVAVHGKTSCIPKKNVSNDLKRSQEAGRCWYLSNIIATKRK